MAKKSRRQKWIRGASSAQMHPRSASGGEIAAAVFGSSLMPFCSMSLGKAPGTFHGQRWDIASIGQVRTSAKQLLNTTFDLPGYSTVGGFETRTGNQCCKILTPNKVCMAGGVTGTPLQHNLHPAVFKMYTPKSSNMVEEAVTVEPQTAFQCLHWVTAGQSLNPQKRGASYVHKAKGDKLEVLKRACESIQPIGARRLRRCFQRSP